MLSRRLQLPQSLTRRRQWHGKLLPQAQPSSPWQPSRFVSHSLSRSHPSPASPRETAVRFDKSKQKITSKHEFQKKNPSHSKGNNDKRKKNSWGRTSNLELDKRLSLRELMMRDMRIPVSKPRNPHSSSSSPSSSSSSLLSEFASWINEPAAEARVSFPTEKDTVRGNGRVLVFESASRHLAESDFYRLASQGQHVDGWVFGITKVIQARSPVTLQPQGKYFLFFDKAASAQEYLQKVLRVHAKIRELTSKGLVGSTINENAASAEGDGQEKTGKEVAVVQADPDQDVQTLLKQYTLLPPGASLKIQRPSEERIRDHFLKLQKEQEQQSRRAKQGSKPLSKDQRAGVETEDNAPKTAQADMFDIDKPESPLELDLPMVEQNKVLVRLTRSKLTVYGLRWAIDADSKRRNLQWRLQLPSTSQSPSSSSSSSYSPRFSSPIQPLEYSKKIVKYSQWNSLPEQDSKNGGGSSSWVDYYSYHHPQADDPDHGGYDRYPPASTAEEENYYSDFKYPDQSWGEERKLWEVDEHEHNDHIVDDGWENKGSPGQYDAKHQGFGSFVVSFVDVHEARRFAREWHKRRIWDHRTERWVTVDATWLW